MSTNKVWVVNSSSSGSSGSESDRSEIDHLCVFNKEKKDPCPDLI